MVRRPKTRRMHCCGLTGINEGLGISLLANGASQSKARSSTQLIRLAGKRSRKLRRDQLQISTRLCGPREMRFRNGRLWQRMPEPDICTPLPEQFREILAG